MPKPPVRQQAQQLPPTTTGPKHAVPCPSCGAPQDFRELDGHQIDTGDFPACDRCDSVMEIVRIQPVTMVVVRRRPDMRARREAPVAQATTLSGATARRMLRR